MPKTQSTKSAAKASIHYPLDAIDEITSYFDRVQAVADLISAATELSNPAGVSLHALCDAGGLVYSDVDVLRADFHEVLKALDLYAHAAPIGSAPKAHRKPKGS
jgi:hypothetical protein